MEDFGIYTEVQKTDQKTPWDNVHSLYSAKCKVCGRTVLRTLYDLKHFNKRCGHTDCNAKNQQKQRFHNEYKFLSPEEQEYNKRVYDLWRAMIKRTYPSYWEKEPTYTGTSVSTEWEDFQTFKEDIKSLPGYELWRDNPGKRIMIDKDTLGNNSKLYSKDTCCFLTSADSNRDVLSRHPEIIENIKRIGREQGKSMGKKIKAINLETQEERVFNSIKECGRELKVSPANIWQCLSDHPKYSRTHSAKGWRFEWFEEQNL